MKPRVHDDERYVFFFPSRDYPLAPTKRVLLLQNVIVLEDTSLRPSLTRASQVFFFSSSKCPISPHIQQFIIRKVRVERRLRARLSLLSRGGLAVRKKFSPPPF